VPAFQVNDCQVDRYGVISAGLLPNSWDRFQLAVEVLTPPRRRIFDAETKKFAESVEPVAASAVAASPFKGERYLWDFGDGQKESTLIPIVEHDYGRRKQERLESEFLVDVTIFSDKGETLRARHALVVHNPAFESLARKNVVLLMSDLTPRWPEVGVDGVVTQRVRIHHTAAGPVTLNRLRVREQTMMGSGSTVRDAGPLEVLGLQVIPAGEGVTISVRLDVTARPTLLYVTYDLSGSTADGEAARGSFSVMRPAPRVTRENHQPIDDPLLLAKVKIARHLLQRPVRDSDLDKLESQGAFRDLRPLAAVEPSPTSNR